MITTKDVNLTGHYTSVQEAHHAILVTAQKQYKRPEGKTLKAIISEGTWSYIVNDKGDAMPYTLQGEGSCTRIEVGEAWIRNLNQKDWIALYRSVIKNKVKKIV